jgi:hypothetical protein
MYEDTFARTFSVAWISRRLADVLISVPSIAPPPGHRRRSRPSGSDGEMMMLLHHHGMSRIGHQGVPHAPPGRRWPHRGMRPVGWAKLFRRPPALVARLLLTAAAVVIFVLAIALGTGRWRRVGGEPEGSARSTPGASRAPTAAQGSPETSAGWDTAARRTASPAS